MSEVEIDVLTGEIQVLRVDLLYDCGQRLVPCDIVLDRSSSTLNFLVKVVNPHKDEHVNHVSLDE